MDVKTQLASALGRRDEAPNVTLAEAIANQGDAAAVQQLTEILQQGAAAQKSDAIKVLYEVGARRVELIAGHTEVFLDTLQHKNNRLIWGALTALAAITPAQPKLILQHLDTIMQAARAGSVIAKDQALQLLLALQATEGSRVEQEIFRHLEESAINQFPIYAERVFASGLDKQQQQKLHRLIQQRLSNDTLKASQEKRLLSISQKILQKIADSA